MIQRTCYELNVYISLKFICWNHNIQYDGVRFGELWEPLWMGLVPLYEETPELAFFLILSLPSSVWGYNNNKKMATSKMGRASQVALVKEPACHCKRCKRHEFDPWVGKIPWRRAWQPTPGFLPGKSMDRGAWRAAVHWGRKELDSTRRQWHPTPVLLPGKSHGRRSLVGCSPWGRWGLDTTERLHFHFSLSCIGEGNGNPLQCSCLENPRDEGAWWAAVYGVAQSRTRLKWLSSSSRAIRTH